MKRFYCVFWNGRLACVTASQSRVQMERKIACGISNRVDVIQVRTLDQARKVAKDYAHRRLAMVAEDEGDLWRS